MSKFFITHSWKDIEFARRLFNDLTAYGLEGWLDDVTLRGGHRLAEQINKGLEWCDVYIPILSRAALQSSWCWEEINAAIALSNKRNRQGRPRIISVLVENCEDELPALLAARLYFNFTNRYDAALKELLNKGFGSPGKVAVPPPSEIVTPFPGIALMLTLNDLNIMELLARIEAIGRWDQTARSLAEIVHQLQSYGQALARSGSDRFKRAEWSNWLSVLSRLEQLIVSPNVMLLRNEVVCEIERRLRNLVEGESARQNWEESYALQKAVVTLKPNDREAIEYLNKLQEAISIVRLHNSY